MVKSLVRWARWGWLVLLLGYCALFFAEPINLTTADLGRHLKNGQLVWQHPELLSTNFYSYTISIHTLSSYSQAIIIPTINQKMISSDMEIILV